MRSDDRMRHRSKGRNLTSEKLDRAQEALAALLRCEDVSGYAAQDLERAQRTIQGLYRRVDDRR